MRPALLASGQRPAYIAVRGELKHFIRLLNIIHPEIRGYKCLSAMIQSRPCVPRRSTRDIQSIDGPMIYAVAEIPPTQHEERALMYVLVGLGSRNYSVAKYARVCTIVAW